MIQLLLEMSICSAVFYGLFIMLYEDKSNHKFNRFYILISLLLSISIPLLSIPVFPKEVVPYISESPAFTRTLIGEETYTLTWESSLFILWLSGVGLNLFFLLRSILSLRRIIKNNETQAEKDHTKVFVNDGMAVSSFFNYLFIPKAQKQTISDYEIKHELTHIRQKHSLDVLFIESIKAFLWFNPIIYLYKKRLVEIHEFLADQNTSNELGKEAYEAFLIRQITTGQQPNLVHNFYSLFKKRLVMMQSNVRLKYWQYGAIIPLFLLCFILFSCENYRVLDTQYTHTYPTIPNKINDSITNYEHDITVYPPIPPELVGKEIDTIFTFNPEDKTMTVHYGGHEDSKINSSELTGEEIDTLIIFDPADYTETMIIVNHETGEVDTIR